MSFLRDGQRSFLAHSLSGILTTLPLKNYDDISEGNADPVIDLGEVTDEALRWWAAVLAPGEGWYACIQHNGRDLKSPWSVKLQSSIALVLSHGAISSRPEQHASASFSSAVRYVLDYARYHGIHDQSRAAFAAALLLPTCRNISKQVCWPLPRHFRNRRSKSHAKQTDLPWGKDSRQLDKLLTMSCNTTGMSSLLSSSFIEPDIPCNVCGAWIQGAFAVLDTTVSQEPHTLAQILMRRSPSLGFLWLGAIIVGVEHHIMKWARPVAFKIDLHSAAWTGTLVSFIRKPVSNLSSKSRAIQRSDEARLMFLSQTENHRDPPLVPFAPFGTIAIEDCILEVQLHALCSGNHGLRYAGWTWDCKNNVKVAHDPVGDSSATIFADDVYASNIVVHYDNLNRERDCSEAMTRNIFRWLRKADGFPVAERPIRMHEWINDG